jgi:N-methylhydantoinase A/oxoprolinase/acetone carboxylase beta subunit
MDLLKLSMDLNLPLIGVGAPSGLLLPKVAGGLKARLVVPENAEVANAVGAVVGNVVETAEITLRIDGAGGLVLFSPWERRHFDRMDEAKEYIMENGTKRLRDAARRCGTASVEISVREDHIEHLGINYYLTATGTPWPAERACN